MAYEYDNDGNLIEIPNFSWVENNVEPLKITVTKKVPDWVDATPQPMQNPDTSPNDIAAYRLQKSVRRDSQLPVEQIVIPEQPKRPSYVMEPDLAETQGGMHLPPGMMQEDSGRLFYKDDPHTTIPMVKRPTLIPVAFTPEGLKPVMPKLLDLVGNVASPLAAGRMPLKAGEMVLGSGAMRTVEEAKKAEPFFSSLERAVDNAKLDKGTPEQWLGYLRNQPGVKSEEIATVLGELPTGQVSKSQMQELVKQNKIELKETWKGDPKETAIMTPDSPSFDPDKIQKANPTKYHSYQLLGGENYKEMLLTLPEKGQIKTFEQFLKDEKYIKDELNNSRVMEQAKKDYDKIINNGNGKINSYKSSHWDEPNVLAHIRMQDRIIDGKKVLHALELQSDWHQAGRKQGYKLSEGQKKELNSIENKISEKLSDAELGNPDMDTVLKTAVDKKIITEAEAKSYKDFSKGENSNIPDAPFKKTWDELALKRLIRHAAENDYHGISWSRGEHNSTNPKMLGHGTEEQREIADKGLQSFYNETLVNKANALGKKHGSKVEQKEIVDPRQFYIGSKNKNGSYDIRFKNEVGEERMIAVGKSKEEAEDLVKQFESGKKGQPIHYIPLTPQLKTKAVEEGFPLFSSTPITVPVDHDPFKEDKKIKLTPVDYDPFK